MQTRSVRRTAAQWHAIVNEYLATEESIESFCNRREFVELTFRKWHQRYTAPQAKTASSTPAFVRAVPAMTSPGPARDVVIECGEVTLRCPSTLGVDAIAELIRAVRA